MKRALVVSVVALFVVAGLATAAQKKAGPKRWEGTIVRSDKDQMTVTVRRGGTNIEKVVHYTADTKWTHQVKGKVEPIEMSEVKDGDRVICLGSYDDKGEFHADRIDKRLPH